MGGLISPIWEPLKPNYWTPPSLLLTRSLAVFWPGGGARTHILYFNTIKFSHISQFAEYGGGLQGRGKGIRSARPSLCIGRVCYKLPPKSVERAWQLVLECSACATRASGLGPGDLWGALGGRTPTQSPKKKKKKH